MANEDSALAVLGVESLGFAPIQVGSRLRITPEWDTPPVSCTSLLAIANRRGWFAAAGPEGIVLAETKAARNAFRAKSSTQERPFEPAIKLSIDTSHRVTHVAFTSDERYLLVSSEPRGAIDVYHVPSVMSRVNEKPLFVIESQGEPLRCLAPNPSLDKAHLVALATNKGNLFVANLTTKAFEGGSTDPLLTNVTALSWSKRGKQLVAGTTDCMLKQLTPTGEHKAEIPRPPGLASDYHLESVAWLENDVFFVAYAVRGGSRPSEFRLVKRESDKSTFHAASIFDMAGNDGRDAHHHILRLNEFPPAIQDILIVSSSVSPETGLLTNSSAALCKQHPEAVNTFAVTIPDEGRQAAVPQNSSFDDMWVVGAALDLSATENVSNPLPYDEEVQETPKPVPGYWVLTNEGCLAAWWLIYSDSVYQKTLFSGMACNSSGQNQSSGPAPAEAGSTTALAPPQTGATTQSSPFGSAKPQPPLTSTSDVKSPFATLAAQPKQSVFASPSGFGASPFSQPANGQSPFASKAASGGGSPFGQPSAPSPFGQPAALSSFGKPSAASPFGQPPAASPFGQSSTASSIGQSSAPSPFGQPPAASSFGKPATTSPLGQPATSAPVFGQPTALGAASKPVFGQPTALGAASQPVFGAPVLGQPSNSSLGGTLSASGSSAAKDVKPPGGGFAAYAQGSAFGAASSRDPPAFGTPSAIGGTPWSQPSLASSLKDSKPTGDGVAAFGQPVFGKPAATSVLGGAALSQPAVKDSNPTGEGATAFGQPVFGKPSISVLGSTVSSQPAAKDSKQIGDGTAAFGQPTFGKPAATSVLGGAALSQPAVKDSNPTGEGASAFSQPTFGKPATTSVLGGTSSSQPPVTETNLVSNAQTFSAKPTASSNQPLFGPLSQPSTAAPASVFGQANTLGTVNKSVFSKSPFASADTGLPATLGEGLSTLGLSSTPANEAKPASSGFASYAQSKVFGETPSKPTNTIAESTTPLATPIPPRFIASPSIAAPSIEPPSIGALSTFDSTSPRSPSPVRGEPAPFPTTISSARQNDIRSFGASGTVNLQKSIMGKNVAAPSLMEPHLKAKARREAEEARVLEDASEFDLVQETLAAEIEPTKTLNEFIAHCHAERSESDQGVPAQVEIVYRDINAMIDTLGLNARSLRSYILGQSRQQGANELKTRHDLDHPEDWIMCEIEDLNSIADMSLPDELNAGRVQDVDSKKAACMDLLRVMGRLRGRQDDLQRIIMATSDPEMIRANLSIPLTSEQTTQQNELRREYMNIGKLLSQAEDALLMLKTKIASAAAASGKSGGNVPTVEAIMRTIQRMTLMAEKRSGDVDVLETQMRKLGISNGANLRGSFNQSGYSSSREDSVFGASTMSAALRPTTPKRSLVHSTNGLGSGLETPNGFSWSVGRSSMLAPDSPSAMGVVNSSGGLRRTPHKKMSGYTEDEKYYLMQKRRAKKVVLGKLQKSLEKSGPRVIALEK